MHILPAPVAPTQPSPQYILTHNPIPCTFRRTANSALTLPIRLHEIPPRYCCLTPSVPAPAYLSGSSFGLLVPPSLMGDSMACEVDSEPRRSGAPPPAPGKSVL